MEDLETERKQRLATQQQAERLEEEGQRLQQEHQRVMEELEQERQGREEVLPTTLRKGTKAAQPGGV